MPFHRENYLTRWNGFFVYDAVKAKVSRMACEALAAQRAPTQNLSADG
ncbi:MAG: hypothetical protein ACOYJK_01510 [Prevotella sp.]